MFMSVFELVMLLCFGAAWPFSIHKSVVSHSVEGKSLAFLLIVWAGYLAGVLLIHRCGRFGGSGMKLKITGKTLTIGDVIRAEEGFTNNREIIDFLARFVVDDDGQPIPHAQAVNMMYELPVAELPALARQLQETITGIQAEAVPLATNAS